MNGLDVPYGYGGGAMEAKSLQPRAVTIKDRIAMAVSQAEQRLVAAKRAKELFDKNPDLEELLNIMQQGSF